MDATQAILLFLTGFLAAIVNTMAGGGSVLTLGMMMLMGMEAPMANGTNRLGLLAQSFSGASAFRKNQIGAIRDAADLAVWAVLGALAGAFLAIRIDTAVFQKLLSLVMIFTIATLFLPPASQAGKKLWRRRWVRYPSFLLIGAYGGFIQAGVGFFIMFALRHLAGFDLIKTNALKAGIVFIYSVPVIFLFGATSHIHWGYAGVLALSMSLGAWLAAHWSIRKGEKLIKLVLAVAIALMAFKFLGA